MIFMYGNYQSANMVCNNTDTSRLIIYNFSSLNERYQKLYLIPPNYLGANNEYDFDIKYMNWIFSNDNVFVEFMKIIMNLYTANDVFLVISQDDEWSRILIESLLKLIQQRYGINAIEINDINDLYIANNVEFEDYGIINLDMDKQRLSEILATMNMRNGIYEF